MGVRDEGGVGCRWKNERSEGFPSSPLPGRQVLIYHASPLTHTPKTVEGGFIEALSCVFRAGRKVRAVLATHACMCTYLPTYHNMRCADLQTPHRFASSQHLSGRRHGPLLHPLRRRHRLGHHPGGQHQRPLVRPGPFCSNHHPLAFFVRDGGAPRCAGAPCDGKADPPGHGGE